MVHFIQKGRTRQEREEEFKRISLLARIIVNRISSTKVGIPDEEEEYEEEFDDDESNDEFWDDQDIQWQDGDVQHYWLSTNPDQWSVKHIEDGSTEFYPSVNLKGFKRRIPEAFLRTKPGDRIIFYESQPVNKVVATGEVTQGLHTEHYADMDKEVEGISLKYSNPVNCVIWETIAGIQDLQGSSPVMNMAHGSLFPLTEEEYDTILSLDEFHTCTLEDAPTYGTGSIPGIPAKIQAELTTTSDDDIYTVSGHEPSFSRFRDKLNVSNFNEDPENLCKEIKIESLYFEDEESILRQICSALANGKHIIFYGPPGTGKSKLAQEICNSYGMKYNMVTATSNWSTFDTIGGYIPEKGGNLRFNPGIFLKTLKEEEIPQNKWLIIDEINRAEIDKAFGSLFSALTGDNITLPQKIRGHHVEIRGKPDPNEKVLPHVYFIHDDWRIIATMNTFDKASLYEMSYAFMRRFSFIPIGLPQDLETATERLIEKWHLVVDDEVKNNVVALWGIINNYRKVGPAIIEDILKYSLMGKDYTSAIIIYALPQFEGIEEDDLRAFVEEVRTGLKDVVDEVQLISRMEDFFDMKF